MSRSIHHVAIVGGGITGLSVAYYLQREIEAKRLPFQFTLIEADSRLGGKIDTLRRDGYVIEKGPDSFLERKRHATQLAIDLGLEHELVNNETGQAYIYHERDLHPIPAGSVMGMPTELQPFLETLLLSTEGKARALEDLLLPVEPVAEDLSVGDFFRRRFGDEMVDRVIEPLISGVYGNPIDHLSLLATFPQYHRLLMEHGSLIKAMRYTRPKAPSKRGKGMFQTVRSGLATIVERIEASLPAVKVRKNAEITRFVKTENGYQLTLKDGAVLDAHSVVFTTPHQVTRKVLRPYLDLKPIDLAEPTSVATVSLAFPRERVQVSVKGTGFIVPRQADLRITACTWLHQKWPHTTPAGKALLRCFVGRPQADGIVHRTDEEIAEMVLEDLRNIRAMDIKGEPEFVFIHRFKESRPPYEVGHQQWVEQITHQVRSALPRVYLAGSFYKGVGLPDCIQQGKEVVGQIVSGVAASPNNDSQSFVPFC
ncbi:protoporphyrinogen oxidase [Laceyella putida]|uniref:Coproporphyrinogen III oxidase n=1 Tax=Laceyella putida TaxID=110101 RepID=A0ABW2RL14_9BACL